MPRVTRSKELFVSLEVVLGPQICHLHPFVRGFKLFDRIGFFFVFKDSQQFVKATLLCFTAAADSSDCI